MGIRFDDLDRKDVIFSHRDDDTGVISIIAVGRLLASNKYRCLPTTVTTVEFDFAEHIRLNCGIELHRLARCAKTVEEAEPITFLKWPDGTDMLVDGNHRYLAAAVMQRKLIKMKSVPASVWKPFLVTELPGEFDADAFSRFQAGWSGIA
jgi:hypothetical protein